LSDIETYQNHIILFDGFCNFCSGIVKYIIKHDKKGKFKFASLQSKLGENYLNHFELTNSSPDTFVYVRNNEVYIKSSAALYVLKDLGGCFKLFFVCIIFPKFFRDFFYNLIAKYRYKLWGKKDVCMIPDESVIERFTK